MQIVIKVPSLDKIKINYSNKYAYKFPIQHLNKFFLVPTFGVHFTSNGLVDTRWKDQGSQEPNI